MRLAFILISLMTIIACKKTEEKTLIVVRDCTATYLRDGEIDLPVANASELASLDSGQVITARYNFPGTKKVSIAYGEDCGIPHEYPRGEWIMVEEFN